eukprot:TRINITY_DN104552_c0_g1_i1.p3 TRINITY_DN104552_c0_g1~~TRINITY_DN104552_c0_g1_i1.p3  ORF type:complete len:143 (-),score=9.89 TRINITY_DN104552_c0_g1_i1:38-466(-)
MAEYSKFQRLHGLWKYLCLLHLGDDSGDAVHASLQTFADLFEGRRWECFGFSVTYLATFDQLFFCHFPSNNQQSSLSRVGFLMMLLLQDIQQIGEFVMLKLGRLGRKYCRQAVSIFEVDMWFTSPRSRIRVVRVVECTASSN